MVMTRKMPPKIWKVGRHPYVGISHFKASGARMADPPP
jgi:hypothetical protein